MNGIRGSMSIGIEHGLIFMRVDSVGFHATLSYAEASNIRDNLTDMLDRLYAEIQAARDRPIPDPYRGGP